MKKYFCDKCGKEKSRLTIHTYKSVPLECMVINEFEICNDCIFKLEKWFKECV